MCVLYSKTLIPPDVLCRYQDPFEEYKTRLAAKLAKRAEGPKTVKPEKKEGDNINWFGVGCLPNSLFFVNKSEDRSK